MPLHITVVNQYKTKEGEYIGRGSPLGNPFPITATEPRSTVIGKYIHYLEGALLLGNEVIIAELDRLAGMAQRGPLKLRCFCAPQPCHGDYIKKILEDAIHGRR